MMKIKKFTLVELLIVFFLIGFMSVGRAMSANPKWYSQEQIMNSVFDKASGALIIKSTDSTSVSTVKILRYASKVSSGTIGVITSTGTIFNALGDVLYTEYYVEGGSGVNSEISNTKLGGVLKMPANSTNDTPYFANPLIAPVINLEVLTPGSSFHYKIIYQKPE